MDRSNKKSFTLIEILVVTTLIVVMSGISMAVLTLYKDDRALNAQVSLFVNTLELAKNKAIAGDVALCSDSQTAHVNGYSVIVNSTGMILLPGCDTVATPIVQTIPTNIAFIAPTFSVQFGSLNYQGKMKRFSIKNTTTNTCKFVQINETGVITNGDCSSCPCLTPTP